MVEKIYLPKLIHYCWFGRNEKSPLVLKCIDSWRKYFPEFDIIEWNEDNFDVNQMDYTREAYECKKWAFVSDYARLKIVYEYGGIYFDTDVEVIKNFEELIGERGYLSFENTTNEPLNKQVNTGVGFAAPPRSKVVQKMLQEYDGAHFLIDGQMDMTPCPVRNTNALKKLGLITDGSKQVICDMDIYPYDYFCGYDIANSYKACNENTCAIHHYTATWKDKISLLDIIKYKIIVKTIQFLVGYEGYKRIKSKLRRHK